jgi:inorganic triphosphatase YgiF
VTIERELKFSTDGTRRPSDHEIASLLHGGGYRSRSQGERLQRDRYFDDAIGSLAAAGIALRRRRIGEERSAALKAGGRIEGALHEREELELPIVGTGWPAEIVARLSEIVDPTTLRSRITLETRRERYRIERDGAPVATLSFDEVEATRPGGSHQISFSEVEIEAIDAADGSELERIAELLEPVVALTPSGTTKLQRAVALLELATWES